MHPGWNHLTSVTFPTMSMCPLHSTCSSHKYLLHSSSVLTPVSFHLFQVKHSNSAAVNPRWGGLMLFLAKYISSSYTCDLLCSGMHTTILQGHFVPRHEGPWRLCLCAVFASDNYDLLTALALMNTLLSSHKFHNVSYYSNLSKSLL